MRQRHHARHEERGADLVARQQRQHARHADLPAVRPLRHQDGAFGVGGVALGALATSSFLVVLALLMLHGASSYGDAGAINGGLMVSSRPETRSAALALFGLFGFTSGFLGPLAVGLILHATGGTSSPAAWFAALLVVGFGSVISAAAMSSRAMKRFAACPKRPGPP